MELTFAQLEKSAAENGLCAYYCGDNFSTIREELQEESSDLTETELKEEIMFRLLDENLDYGAFSEQVWEFDGEHDAEHSKRMEIRTTICEKVAHAWVAGEVDSIETAQKYVEDLIQKML